MAKCVPYMQLYPFVLIGVSLYFNCLPINLDSARGLLLIVEHIMHVSIDETSLSHSWISHYNELPVEVWTVLVIVLGLKGFCVIHYKY